MKSRVKNGPVRVTGDSIKEVQEAGLPQSFIQEQRLKQ